MIGRWMPASTKWAAAAIAVVLWACGCATTSPQPAAPWDVGRAERLVWTADDQAFGQGFALETSGLAFVGNRLAAPSEKYGRVLFIDQGDGLTAQVVELGVPVHAELEGLAWRDGEMFLCDEAHAAVYRVEVGPQSELLPRLAAVELDLEGVRVDGSKIGVEGIEVARDGEHVFLLLERSGSPATGCVSRLWRLRIDGDALVADHDPVDIPLEDCNWRLTGLAWMDARLLGLKTQYPGSRYEVVEVDPETGAIAILQDLTDYLRDVRDDGWGNNVEGIAVADDGALWLIGDNAVTGVIDDPYPPETDEKALLVRIPQVE